MAKALIKEVIGVHFWVLAGIASVVLFNNHFFGNVMFVVLSVGLLISIGKRIFKYHNNKKNIAYLSHASVAGHDTLNCYVKLHGRVVGEEVVVSPYSHEGCVGFTYLVFGARKVKQKKPSSGTTIVENKLHTEHSLSPLIIDNGSDRIALDLGDLMVSGRSWVDSTMIMEVGVNPIVGTSYQKTYEYYRVVEKQFKQDDEITVFGLLEEDNEQLVIRASDSKKHPMVLAQGTPDMLYSKLTDDYRIKIIWLRVLYLLCVPLLYGCFS